MITVIFVPIESIGRRRRSEIEYKAVVTVTYVAPETFDDTDFDDTDVTFYVLSFKPKNSIPKTR